MRQPVYFAAAHQTGRANVAAGAALTNLYAQGSPQGAKGPAVLHGTPGSILFADIDNYPVRGLHRFGGKLYAVTNKGFYAVTGKDTFTKIADVTVSGPVSFADNGTVMVFVDGARGYKYDGTDFAEIRDAAFFPADNVVYLDGYFVFNRNGTGQFFITRLFSTVFDALDFATAESAPDDIMSVLADHRELWLFGAVSVEVWWNVGTADFPFQRIQGAVIEHGCASPWCTAKANNTVYWLSDEGIVYAASGYQPQRISTHEMEYDIRGLVLGTATAFAYVDEGHWFYQLTLGAVTWVFDISTGLWHKRSHIDHGRHHASCYARAFDKHIIGDFSTGKLYEWSLDIHHDDFRPLISEAVCAPIHRLRARLRHKSFEIDFDAGGGLIDASALDETLPLAGASEVTLHYKPWDDAVAPIAQVADVDPGSGIWTFNRGTVALATGAIGANSGLPIVRLASIDTGGTLEEDETGRMGVYVDLVEEGHREDLEYTIRNTLLMTGTIGADTFRWRKFQADGGGVATPAEQALSFMPPDATNIVEIFDTGLGVFSASPQLIPSIHPMTGKYNSFVVEGGGPNLSYTEVGEITTFLGIDGTSEEAQALAQAGVDPTVVLEFSDDGGKTWSNERPRPMGQEGKYLERAIWFRLGQARDRRYRIRISDPVKRAILGTAYVEAGP